MFIEQKTKKSEMDPIRLCPRTAKMCLIQEVGYQVYDIYRNAYL